MTMLSVQYRMHPKISKFISRYFYQGQLKDGTFLDRYAVQTFGHRHVCAQGLLHTAVPWICIVSSRCGGSLTGCFCPARSAHS